MQLSSQLQLVSILKSVVLSELRSDHREREALSSGLLIDLSAIVDGSTGLERESRALDAGPESLRAGDRIDENGLSINAQKVQDLADMLASEIEDEGIASSEDADGSDKDGDI